MSITEQQLLRTLEVNRLGLLRFLRARLGDNDRAEDVLQSMSEHVLTRSSSEALSNPQSYLFRMAANAANSHMRGERTRVRYENEAAAHAHHTDERHPERIVLGQDALHITQQALDELPALTKRMFILFRVQGTSQKDIAKHFGVSLSTVEKRIAKAALHCQKRLSEQGYTGLGGELRLNDKQSTRKSPR